MLNEKQEERFLNILKGYKTIQKFTIQTEILAGRFPVAVLNEIRALYTHVCRIFTDSSVASDSAEIDKELDKLESHTKRAILDSYKYACMDFSRENEKFEKVYRNVDFTVVDNGDFLKKRQIAKREAMDKLIVAKETEARIIDRDTICDDSLYIAYEEAYIAYDKLYELNNKAIDVCRMEKKKHDKGRILNIVLGLISLGSIIATIVSLT